MITFKTTSPEQTESFGRELAESLIGGDVIALTGDLGAGKTCLTRGIAAGLGSVSHVSSPTFTIVNEYEGGRLMLFHFDTYTVLNGRWKTAAYSNISTTSVASMSSTVRSTR